MWHTETNRYDVSSSVEACGGKADWLPTALRKGIGKSVSLRQTGQYENSNPNREGSNAGNFVVKRERPVMCQSCGAGAFLAV